MTSKRDLLPSQKTELKQEQAAQADPRKEAHDALVRSMRITFASPDGQVVLKWLHDQAGYNKSKVVANPQTGEINPMATTYGAIRETMYCAIRKFLTFDILKEVEHDGQ